jgi:plasmid stabilization system protein ParE
MAHLKLFWTITAKKQRDHVFEYWNSRNGNTNFSMKLNQKIRERTSLLKSHPFLGKEIAKWDNRSVSLGHYSIVYKVEEEKIIITAFWDNRQDSEKLYQHLRQN